MNIEVAWENFRLQLIADGRSGHTISQYERHIRLLAHWAADVGHSRETGALVHEDLAQFLSSLTARTRPDGGLKKASSMNCLRSSLRTFFGYLHRAGVITTDPARMVRRALCSPPPPRGLSHAERDQLLRTLASAQDSLAERDHALFHFMLATGIRVGSVVAIVTEDIDLERGEVLLRTAKRGRSDRVLLGDQIREHIVRYLDGRTSGPLFPGRHGGRLTARHIARRLVRWVEHAGIDRVVSPHMLRHTFAANLYQKTRDVLLVKSALHHRSVASTLVYARPDEEALRAVL